VCRLRGDVHRRIFDITRLWPQDLGERVDYLWRAYVYLLGVSGHFLFLACSRCFASQSSFRLALSPPFDTNRLSLCSTAGIITSRLKQSLSLL